jgi:hypothetical protein
MHEQSKIDPTFSLAWDKIDALVRSGKDAEARELAGQYPNGPAILRECERLRGRFKEFSLDMQLAAAVATLDARSRTQQELLADALHLIAEFQADGNTAAAAAVHAHLDDPDALAELLAEAAP